ncbi:MAG: cation diffusion facilitator family transporter, partial [Fibrobacter sp.]|nr:cation diffusion facilitator family transporter [Fibrobacter sp.]
MTIIHTISSIKPLSTTSTALPYFLLPESNYSVANPVLYSFFIYKSLIKVNIYTTNPDVNMYFYFMQNFNSKQHSICEKALAMQVSTISIIVNVLLSVLKLLAGIFAKSGAMVSDAVHSASDVFSTFIVIIGVNLAGKESDKDHQYGHERLECVASVVLAVILAFTGLGIGIAAVEKVLKGDYSHLQVPGLLALIAAIVSIAVKEWMYWFTRGAAKKINSGALMADAWHHRSDALSSVGSFVGIFGARMGFPIL